MLSPIIRQVVAEDLDRLVELCAAHALYEQSTYDPRGKKELLAAHFLSPQSTNYCIVAEVDDLLVGYATYMKQFSTWDGCHYMYMDCLYLEEAARGLGTGPMLMNKMKLDATSMGITMIQWQTPNFNTRAIKFYKRIGGASKSKERFFWDIG